ncbi:class I SAM-dependent methyltransferase [Cellulomonas sp. ACRRI]|uniref:class I SAM-dependent methyltransferase n=1 Tax=Cellulomonas sp. ACRRI TaxID=2918188 RepID=UPI001EF2FFD3|nr:class I SAM-dependent methyltransferase [Cellulomonas sp. ACRRI]MCG7285485.1 class I SAM-dependent methyltransferase [Cellulomonas sp. ACRRI]
MPDPIFADPRLAPLYDVFDDDRADLELYRAVAREVGARRVLDVGCGTGTLALLLAGDGLAVTGVDPAAASLDVARAKPGADRVTWLHGDATTLPPLAVDLVTMTGNVAQVFLEDADWSATLRGIRAALAPGGHLVLETRRPEARAWEAWAEGEAGSERDVPGTGRVVEEFAVTAVTLPLVSFRSVFRFPDGTEVPSASTLRFRTLAEVRASLAAAGLTVVDVRDAPDRPGLEHVVLARRGD